MKKLITLTVVLLFSTAAAFAQSSEAYIDQMDQNNDVYLHQSDGATAEISQAHNGYNLLRGIGQMDAYSNASDLSVTQNNWGSGTNAQGNPGNELRVMQYGSGHSINATQHNDGYAKIEQRGNNNSSQIQQYLGDQEADIFQNNRENSVTLLQNNGGSEGSYADVDQTGRLNTLEGIGGGRAEQLDGNNELYLSQTGNNSTVQLLQDSQSTGLLNMASVDQFSNGNFTEISQTGGNNNAFVTQ